MLFGRLRLADRTSLTPVLYNMECPCTGCCFRPKLSLPLTSTGLWQQVSFLMLLVPLNQVFDPTGCSSMYEQCLCSFTMEKCGLLVGRRKHQRLPSTQEKHKGSSSRVPRSQRAAEVCTGTLLCPAGAEQAHECTSPGAQGSPSVATGMQCVMHRAESRDVARGGKRGA